MTDTKVSQLTALLQGVQNVSTANEKGQKTEAVFGALLSQTSGNGYENRYSWTQQVDKASASVESNRATYEKEAAKSSFKDKNFVKQSNTDVTDKLPKDTKEQVEEFAAKVKEALEDKLDVSEEELVQVMEELGITFMDLAEPTKMIQLAMELTGSQDGSELLLNPDFQTLMTQVEELFSQLTESLNLTPEEFQMISQELSEISGQQQNVSEEATVEVSMEATEEIHADSKQQAEIQVQDNTVPKVSEEPEAQNGLQTEKTADSNAIKLTEEDLTEENLTEEAEEQTTVKQSDNVAEEQTDEEPKKDADKQKSPVSEIGIKTENGTKNSQQTQISFQSTTQTINNGQTVEVVQTMTRSTIDVESVLRQISQMTRISVTQAQSSIEMQLNPENLGKVYLQVVSKEGAITAQIAAQNEAVKEVLESQIAVLKDNMNQQGMKVEAIEVTVASHEFERNLEENQDNPAKEQKEAEKSSGRGINLNNLDELEGLMSEEETLAAKIMRDNGNSVNLTA